jgi:arylsulfatase A-like enzyme
MSDVWLGKARMRMKPLMWEWRFRIMGEPFHHSPELAIRDGQWKLLMNPDRSRVELYDLSNDLTQLNNVAEHHADIVERLGKQVSAWAATLPAGPRDPGAGQMNVPMPGQKRPTSAKKQAK